MRQIANEYPNIPPRTIIDEGRKGLSEVSLAMLGEVLITLVNSTNFLGNNKALRRRVERGRPKIGNDIKAADTDATIQGRLTKTLSKANTFFF